MFRTRKVKNEKNKWRIVLIKTIDNKVPIYYRVYNMNTCEVRNIAAHKIIDEIINNKMEIINIKVENGQIVTLDEDGYESTDKIILVDEFEDSKSLFDYCLSYGRYQLDGDDLGTNALCSFDETKNEESPSDIKIDSHKKIYWTCRKGHTINCSIPTYFGMKCECPICKLEENGETPSLNYWAHLTNNLDILKQYESAFENLASSTDIGWRERRKVFFKNGGNVERAFLSDVTAKGKQIEYKEECGNNID